MTQEEIDFLIEFFRKARLNAREQEGEVWVSDGNGSETVVIEQVVVIPF